MSLEQDSHAVEVARKNVVAWSSHDLAATRATVAEGVVLAVTSAQPDAPGVKSTGIGDYMTGLETFIKGITPGSYKEIAAIGDDRNALMMFTVEADFGHGKVPLVNARVVFLDEDDKIAAEQVLFFFG